MNHIIKGIHTASRVLSYVSMASLAVMLFLDAGDVLGRYFIGRPIKGAEEISEILLPAIVLFGWAYTQSLNRHVAVDLLVDRLSDPARRVIVCFTSFIALIIFSIILWKGAEFALRSWQAGELINTIYIPIAPFQFFTVIGAFFMCLELIAQIVTQIAPRESQPASGAR
jgi:TRAP-type C4-dicarboxylate transport system permease small subunit